MTRSILVLGASIHQLLVIRAAKKKGLIVHVADNLPTNPGHQEADFSHNIDTTEVNKIIDLAQGLKIDAVMAPCTDVAVFTAAKVSNKLGLPGVPCFAADVLTRKLAFRGFQQANGFNHPRYLELGSTTSEDEIDSFGLCVVKPDQSSGSKGVIITSAADNDFHQHAESAGRFSQNGVALIEEFIQGSQGTIEGVLINGQIKLAFFLDRKVASPPFVCTYGHAIPSQLSSEVKQAVLTELRTIFSVLEISDTAFDADFVFDGERLYILEMSPRLGGNSISGLVYYSTGVDLADIAIDIALGDPVNINQNFSQKFAAVILLGVLEAGVVEIDKSCLKKIRNLDWADNLNVYVSSGDAILPFVNGQGCLASLFITAPNMEQLNARTDQVRAMTLFRIVDQINAKPV